MGQIQDENNVSNLRNEIYMVAIKIKKKLSNVYSVEDISLQKLKQVIDGNF